MTAQIAKRIEPRCAEVRNEDLSSFIDVLTESYALDRKGAEEIFFADPYFSLPNKRALWLDGEMASCLTLVDREACFGDRAVPISGICGVATRPKFRSQGHATALMTHALEELERRKVAFALLNPVSADLYRSLGFEFVAHSDRLTLSPKQLPHFPVSDQVRPIVKRDIPAMAMLYETRLADQPLALVRDLKRWTFLLQCQKEAIVFAPRSGGVEGYMILDRIPDNGEEKISLRVLEMCAGTPLAQRAFVGYLANQAVERLIVEGTANMHARNGLMELDYADDVETATIERMPNTMARISSFQEAVSAATSGCLEQPNLGEEAVIRLRLNSSGLLSQVRTCLLAVTMNSIAVLPDDFPETALQQTLTGDVSAWTRMLLGTISGESAVQQGLLAGSSSLAVEVASQLFPLRHPNLSPADFF